MKSLALKERCQNYSDKSYSNIRSATLEDVAHLLPLMEQLGYTQTSDSMKRILSSYEGTPGHYTIVAELEDNIVGLVTIVGYHSFVYEELMFRVTTLVVDQAVRGQGIGKQLMAHAEMIARQQNGKVIDLTSGLRRAKDGSHEFYKALGYDNEGDYAKLYLRKEL